MPMSPMKSMWQLIAAVNLMMGCEMVGKTNCASRKKIEKGKPENALIRFRSDDWGWVDSVVDFRCELFKLMQTGMM